MCTCIYSVYADAHVNGSNVNSSLCTCMQVPRHMLAVCGPYAWMLSTIQKTLPRQFDDKYRTAWHDSKIIYLAPLLFSSMVFVKSEETICCPVIMGGWGGGDWK